MTDFIRLAQTAEDDAIYWDRLADEKIKTAEEYRKTAQSRREHAEFYRLRVKQKEMANG